MQDAKIEIKFGKHDLSSFIVYNTLVGLEVHSYTFNQAKLETGLPTIMNVEMTLTKGLESSKIYGELTIADYIAGVSNFQTQTFNVQR